MARSIWKGSITFGLVNIPVGLYSAEKTDELHFKLLDRRNLSPVRYKRVDEGSNREVPWEQIVRGYEYEEGQYVVLSDEDLKQANPEATQTVDILGFVEGEEISPLYFDKPYYLGPQKKGGKSYALLRETLRRTGKVGIAKVVIRTRQYLAALYPQDDVLVLNLLRFEHELRDTDDLELPHGLSGVSEKELEMAERLVEGMVAEWDPGEYKDDYRTDLLKMIEHRVEAGETKEVEAPAPRPRDDGKVVDLMMLLKRSVEVSREGPKAGKSAGKAPAKAKAKSKPAANKSVADKSAAKKPARKSTARKPAARRAATTRHRKSA